MIKELVCITCPRGCQLSVEVDDRGNVQSVSGNSCPRGEIYGSKEVKAPERMITSTVRIDGGVHPLLPVISERAIPKNKIWEVMREIQKVRVVAPVRYRDVIIENAGGTGVAIIASRTMKKVSGSF